jgi:membrane-bound lytic murein transglycosylase D
MHFQQLAVVLNIPIEKITALNPQFRFSIVPGDKNYRLALPAGQREEFLTFQDSIYNAYDSALFQLMVQKIEYPPAPTRQYAGEKVKDLEIEGKTKIKYLIKTGDVLGFIAEDYDVRVADLKYWNNIYNERKIQAGQTIDIFVDNDQVDYYRNLSKTGNGTVQVDNENGNHSANVPNYAIPDSAKKVEHVVKSGESPYVIAKKYKGVTPEAILQWNGISDSRKIQIGQKLTIYVKQ